MVIDAIAVMRTLTPEQGQLYDMTLAVVAEQREELIRLRALRDSQSMRLSNRTRTIQRLLKRIKESDAHIVDQQTELVNLRRFYKEHRECRRG